MNQTEAARTKSMDRPARIKESKVMATHHGMVDENFVKDAHVDNREVTMKNISQFFLNSFTYVAILSRVTTLCAPCLYVSALCLDKTGTYLDS